MREISLFPLNTVLYPGMPLPLHIFEERYLTMINRCLNEQSPFGVVSIRHGIEAMGPLPEPQKIGCLANIVHFSRLEDGRINLLTIGGDRFKIIKLNNEGPYLTGLVDIFPIETQQTPEEIIKMLLLKPSILRYLELMIKIQPDADQAELPYKEHEFPENPLDLLYMASSILQLPVEEKQELLEAETIQNLWKKITRIYRRELAVLGNMHTISTDKANRAAWLN